MAGAGGVYTGGGATVVMNPAPVVYVKVFHPSSGPERHLRRKAESVALTARVIAPRRTGRLAANIKVDQNRNELGRYAFGFKVYTPVYYGGYVHEGTAPSPRWPVEGKAMKFLGRRNDIAYADFVMHPGTPAQPFLQNALVAMVG